MKLTRRRLLASGGAAVGLALAGCRGQGAAATNDIGAPKPQCLVPSSGNGLHYCLVEPATVRVPGAAMLTPGQVVLYNVDDSTAVIVARDDRGFYALSGICTHQCCVLTICDGDCGALLTNPGDCKTTPNGKLAATSAAFVCACHGSEFGADGSVLTGPATDPLPASPLTIDGSDLVVDLGQITDPDRRTT